MTGQYFVSFLNSFHLQAIVYSIFMFFNWTIILSEGGLNLTKSALATVAESVSFT